MLKNKLLVLLFFLTGTLFAQTTPPSAIPIMEKTVKKLNALAAFSIDFTLNVEEKGKKTQDFAGVLIVKKEKYYLTFQDQIIVNDGIMMWNYQKNSNEVSIFDADDDDFSMLHPLKMLNDWEKEYGAKFIREDDLNKNRVNILDLTPKKKSQFYKIRLFINKTTSYIQQIMMYDMDGTTLTYTVAKFTPNAAVEDSKFIFNKKDYPDVQVNDMR
jgi:outer membrane lipoprotein-sorting protein